SKRLCLAKNLGGALWASRWHPTTTGSIAETWLLATIKEPSAGRGCSPLHEAPAAHHTRGRATAAASRKTHGARRLRTGARARCGAVTPGARRRRRGPLACR